MVAQIFSMLIDAYFCSLNRRNKTQGKDPGKRCLPVQTSDQDIDSKVRMNEIDEWITKKCVFLKETKL